MNLHTADAILAIDQHPESSHPLVKSKRRILKDRCQLKRELFLTGVAKPDAPCLDERVLILAASGTNQLAIRPAKFLGIVESALRIGEINVCLL
jgi:hypothetical protein